MVDVGVGCKIVPIGHKSLAHGRCNMSFLNLTFMCRYGGTKDDSLTNKAFFSIDELFLYQK